MRAARDVPDRRYVFFLGAGCSVRAGIPDSRQLVRDIWLPRLKEFRDPHRTDFDAWVKEQFPGYDPESPAASYGSVIEALFPKDADRQAEFERLCEAAEPDFAYSVLARLMATEGGTFNVVLTTNFDDLVSDALYLFTELRPLVVQHHSLSGFIRPTRTRPLVVKLHGDHRLAPMNTAREISEIEATAEVHVRELLTDRGLIFMGYGGGDAGILKMLHALPSRALHGGVYWVGRRPPRGEMLEWLKKVHAIFVESQDFSETMLLLSREFELEHPSRQRFDRIFERYAKSFHDLDRQVSEKARKEPATTALQSAAQTVADTLPDMWASLSRAWRLRKEDPEEAGRLYERLVQQFPSSAEVLSDYAVFLEEDRKDYDRAEATYTTALALQPRNAATLGNYAVFLEKVRNRYDEAEEKYEIAIDVEPNGAINLGNYAQFLRHVRREVDHADALFRRAVDADPTNAGNIGNYASFLTYERKAFDQAEALYQRSIAIDPKGHVNLGNYALFLAEVRRDFANAELHHLRALDAEPRDANNRCNYAGFLFSLGRTGEAMEQAAAARVAMRATDEPLALELAFFTYAHGPPKERAAHLQQAKDLILRGVRSMHIHLADNVSRAAEEGHPEADWLGPLAEVIRDRVSPSSLDAWPAWAKVKVTAPVRIVPDGPSRE